MKNLENSVKSCILRNIFTQIAAKGITLYGSGIKNINFDTTSKVNATEKSGLVSINIF